MTHGAVLREAVGEVERQIDGRSNTNCDVAE